MSSPSCDLFGGAITAVIPSNFIDASDLRQVPDNQEVFLDPNSDLSIIIEVLQKVEPIDSFEAIRFHFASVAHDNSAEKSVVEEVNQLAVIDSRDSGPTLSATILYGVQHVQKFNRRTFDEVHIFMCLFRVEEKNIDLVVTFNVPSNPDDSDPVSEASLQQAKTLFLDLVRSLRIVDYGLFV